MKKPLAFQLNLPIEIADGVVVPTLSVWQMFEASVRGDIQTVKQLVTEQPALIDGRYDYTSPIHFAAREGHLDLVTFFVEHGALDAEYYVHPFKIGLDKLADDRGHHEIAKYLSKHLATTEVDPNRWDTGRVDYGFDEEQKRFQRLVDEGGAIDAVRSMLAARPDLAKLKTALWGEGILCGPANSNNRPMVELLMEYGATVPEMSKWGARYYFKHFEMAKLLLENGMSANHMNWREFTLVHDMIYIGHEEKLRLLLEFGADVNAVDDELALTPLGWASYWDKPAMKSVMLEYGAID